MIIIHVIRKPCSEGSVGKNALKFGTGGINVDGSRIAGVVQSNTGFAGYGVGADRVNGYCPGTGRGYSNSGRWPANLVLQHRPECRCTGTTKIKGTQGSGLTQTDARSWKNASVAGINRVGYGDADGAETVSIWECHKGCPVADLDEQSGILTSGALHGVYQNTLMANTPWRRDGKPILLQQSASTGGASRFFKQVGGQS